MKKIEFKDDAIKDLGFSNEIAYIALNNKGEQRYELQTGGTRCNHPIVRGKLIPLGYKEYYEIIEALKYETEEIDIKSTLTIKNIDLVIKDIGLSVDTSRKSEEGCIAIKEFGGNAYLIYENSYIFI